jgi:hypothetical protein
LKDKRTINVVLLWNKGDYAYYGLFLRDVVKLVKTLHQSKYGDSCFKNNNTIESLVKIMDNAEKGTGARNVQFHYIQTLMTSKIVVFAQPDEWEDQYRLMESLASGALVLTDSMLAPPEGLVNNTTIPIVLFTRTWNRSNDSFDTI